MVTTHRSPETVVPASVAVADENKMSPPPESFAVVVRITAPAFATSCRRPSTPAPPALPFSTKPSEFEIVRTLPTAVTL